MRAARLPAILLVLLTTLARSPPAAADATAESRIMVLLPFDRGDATLTKAEWTLFEESLRSTATPIINGLGYNFLNGDTLLQQLEDNGVDAAAACDKSCALGVAREIKARYFLSGTVASAEGSHTAFVRLIDSVTGQTVATVKLEGENAKALAARFDAKAEEFLGKLPPRAAVPGDTRIGGGPVAPVFGARTVLAEFTSVPPGATVSLDNNLLCPSTPCSRAVVVGSHSVSMQKERYETVAIFREFREKASISLELPPLFGWVSITTDPVGLPVTIDGQPGGTSPIARVELEPGQHEILAADACHTRTGERVTIVRNAGREVRITAEPTHAALEVVAEDESGNALEAGVFVDGVGVGGAPGSFVVPACAKELLVTGPSDRLPFKQPLALREGETRSIVAVLAGSVEHAFTSTPEGATVTVDGLPACVPTPCRARVRPGRHRVGLLISGYDLLERTEEFREGGESAFELVETARREREEAAASTARWATIRRIGLGIAAIGGAGYLAYSQGPAFQAANSAAGLPGLTAWLPPALSLVSGARFADDLGLTIIDPFVATSTLGVMSGTRAAVGSGPDLTVDGAILGAGFLAGAGLRAWHVLPDLHGEPTDSPSVGRWVATLLGTAAAVGTGFAMRLPDDGLAHPQEAGLGALAGFLTPTMLIVSGLAVTDPELKEDKEFAALVLIADVAVIVAQSYIVSHALDTTYASDAPDVPIAPQRAWLVGDLAGVALCATVFSFALD